MKHDVVFVTLIWNLLLVSQKIGYIINVRKRTNKTKTTIPQKYILPSFDLCLCFLLSSSPSLELPSDDSLLFLCLLSLWCFFLCLSHLLSLCLSLYLCLRFLLGEGDLKPLSFLCLVVLDGVLVTSLHCLW